MRSILCTPLLVLGATLVAGVAQGQSMVEQMPILQARAATAGMLEIGEIVPTAEDPSVLFVSPPQEAQRMLLFDTITTRAVLAEDLGPQGLKFKLIDPGRSPETTEFSLGPDGYFGPPEALASLAISDPILTDELGRTCQQPCLDHGNMTACAACSAVTVLLRLREVSPQAPSPSPPVQTPSPIPTPVLPVEEIPPPVPTPTEVEDPSPEETPFPSATPTHDPVEDVGPDEPGPQATPFP